MPCFCCEWSPHLEWPPSPTKGYTHVWYFSHILLLSQGISFSQVSMLKAPQNGLCCEKDLLGLTFPDFNLAPKQEAWLLPT